MAIAFSPLDHRSDPALPGTLIFVAKPIVRGDRGTDRRSPLSRQVAPTTPGFEAAAPAKKAVTTHARKSRVRSAS
jgi:hypothetical protein